MSARPLLLAHPGTHGVAVYSRDLAVAVTAAHPEVEVVEPADLLRLDPGTTVHAQFTDRLWADSPEEASRLFTELAARLRISVTLHDVPQESDGPRNRVRRRDAYALVARSARGVVVNSAHESALLREEDVWAGPVARVPLPVEVLASSTDERAELDGTVGVLGYFYPGKGHDEAASAAAAAGLQRMTVLGRASEGHAEDLAAFVRRARSQGVAVDVTGWLDDAEIARRGRAVSVPLIAHRHVSASGSLASWIGWGRRPVAMRNRYIDEMAALRPGTLTVADESDLAAAVRRAAADPASTRHGRDRVPGSWDDAVDAYTRWWAERGA